MHYWIRKNFVEKLSLYSWSVSVFAARGVRLPVIDNARLRDALVYIKQVSGAPRRDVNLASTEICMYFGVPFLRLIWLLLGCCFFCFCFLFLFCIVCGDEVGYGGGFFFFFWEGGCLVLFFFCSFPFIFTSNYFGQSKCFSIGALLFKSEVFFWNNFVENIYNAVHCSLV